MPLKWNLMVTLMNHSQMKRNSIHIQGNTIYRHQTVRINYTTYNMQRDYDTTPLLWLLHPRWNLTRIHFGMQLF